MGTVSQKKTHTLESFNIIGSFIRLTLMLLPRALRKMCTTLHMHAPKGKPNADSGHLYYMHVCNKSFTQHIRLLQKSAFILFT